MSYKIEYISGFEKDIKKLQRRIVNSIFAKLNDLPDKPRPHGYKKIRGYIDLYRIRFGDYRVVYKINDKEKTVCLIRARHRSKVYEGLIG